MVAQLNHLTLRNIIKSYRLVLTTSRFNNVIQLKSREKNYFGNSNNKFVTAIIRTGAI